jgi:hypothetical protein
LGSDRATVLQTVSLHLATWSLTCLKSLNDHHSG